MHIFVCVEDRLGMAFGGRRVSRDRAVTADMLRTAAGRLFISSFSADLFEGAAVTVLPEDRFPADVPEDGFCLIENLSPARFAASIDGVTLYRWNRRYPADLHFDLPLTEPMWRLRFSETLQGYSHPEIIKEVYCK